ncbi:MAG TPA: TonB-dependent receptor, partial [Lautropia sp.]|nr:TonB-dependent receptor [Lautropia sp.]
DSRGPLVLLGLPIPIPPTLTVFSESESFVQELRAVSQGDGPFRWVVGDIYQDARNLEDIVVSFGPPISAVSEFDSKSWALFGEASIGLFNDTLRPLVGLRYFKDERSFFTRSRAPVLGTPTSRDAVFDSISPRFNLSWTPNEDINLYVNVAKGFRSGTFNNAAAVQVGGGSVGFEVDPDQIWSYEVGGKINLIGNSLYLEATAYYLDWSDIQLNYTVAGGVQIIRNAGDVEGKGVELVLNWRPTRGLNFNASANLNQTEFVRLVNPAVFAATPHIRVGRQVASVPDKTLNLGATYQQPIGLGGADIFLSAQYSYIAEQADVGDPLGRFGSDHNLLRARVGLQWDNFGIHLFGENLLEDKDPIIVSGSGSSRYYPRVIGVEVSFDF